MMGMHETLEEIRDDISDIEQRVMRIESMKEKSFKKEVSLLAESYRDLSQRLERMETLMESMTLLLKRITETMES